MSQGTLLPVKYTGIPIHEEVVTEGRTPTPVNVVTIVSDGEVTVTCDTVEGANKYNFYRDGNYQSTQAQPLLIDSGLSNGTYLYSVSAVDESRDSPDDISEISAAVQAVVNVTSDGISNLVEGSFVISSATSSSFIVSAEFTEVCRLRTYVDTFSPPTALARFENSLSYSDHNGTITGLNADTLYYVQIEAEFADGSKSGLSDVITQRTADASNALGTSGMLKVDIGADKALGTVGDTEWDAWMWQWAKDYDLNGGARIGVTSIASRKSIHVELSSAGASDGTPTNRVSIGYDLSPNRTYRISQWVYIPSDFVGGGTNNGNPYGTIKLGFGLYGGEDVSGGIFDPAGFSERFVIDVMSDNSLRLAIYDYAVDRAGQWGDRHVLPNYLNRGAWNVMAMEIKANSSTSASDGTIRAWQDPFNTTPSLVVSGKKFMGEGTPGLTRVKVEVFGGGQGIAQYGLPSPQDLYFGDIYIGPGSY